MAYSPLRCPFNECRDRAGLGLRELPRGSGPLWRKLGITIGTVMQCITHCQMWSECWKIAERREMRTQQMAKVSHMVLPVSDVHKSRDWYVDKLGFKVEREHEGVVGIKDQSGLTIFLQKTAGSLAGQKITLTIQVDNVDSKHQE